MRGSRGAIGGHLENHKVIRVLSNTGLDPLENHKAARPSQHAMLDHHRPTSETPFKWRFACRPMMVCF